MTILQNEPPAIAVRRRRLREWIETRFEGSQVRFIADCSQRGHELNQGELSGLLKAKSFGEKKARKLEEIAQMPHHFLNPTGEYPQIHGNVSVARESTHENPYLWPFKNLPSSDYFEVLTEADRKVVENTAIALFQARSSPIKQIRPAINKTASRSSA